MIQKMKYLPLLMTVLLGCASEPLTEDELYERADRRNRTIEAYETLVSNCSRSGGYIVIPNKTSTRRTSIWDMKLARCEHGPFILQ